MKSSPLHRRIHKHVATHVRRVHKHVSHHTTHLLSSIRQAQLYRWYRAHLPAFTLTDTLVATGIFLILTSTVLVAINPLKMFVDSRNNKRIRELKVVRDSLVQYTTDNTSGATNILGVSIPPCTESPGTEIGTGEGKVDLSNLSGFIPTYLSSIPIDPKIGTAASTGYRVCRTSDLDYCVTAMYPESAGSSTVTMDCDYSIITPSPTPPGVPTSTPTPTAAPVTSGLVLSHQMSAGSGTTSLDETTNANNGTLTNGPTWTTGYLGSGISFDGTNDYITVPHSSTLAITGDITFTAWVKPTDRSNYFGIIGKTSGSTAAPYDYYLSTTTGVPKLLRGNGSGSTSVDASAAPATGQWSHVAVVMSGTTVTHYLNGVANGSGTLSTTTTDAGGALRIGSRADDGTMFKGLMDDVRIYNRALSSTEIAQIKAPAPTPTITNTPSPTPTLPPLLAWWNFDEVAGNSAADSSGNNLTGTFDGFQQWTTGHINGGVRTGIQSGQDGVVNFGDNLDFAHTASRSFCAWINPSQISGNQPILYKVDSTTGQGWGFIITANKLAFYYINTFGSDYTSATSTSDLTLNTWQHVCAVYNNGSASLYLNGNPFASTPAGTISTSVDTTASLKNWYSGVATTYPFKGIMDEVKVYGGALTEGHITMVYNNTTPTNTPTPTPTITLTPTNTPTATPTPTITNTPIPTPTSGGGHLSF